MKDYTGCKRVYTRLSRAHYGKKLLACEEHTDEIMMRYQGENVSSAEIAIRWYDLLGRSAMRLEAFDDTWAALSQWTDFIQMLGNYDNKDIPPDAFEIVLLQLGFEDITPVDNPDGEDDAHLVCPHCRNTIKLDS